LGISVVLLLGLQEALGAAFGICIIVWSVALAWGWIIKGEREERRRQIQKLREETHRKHWQQVMDTRQRPNAPQ
jgi:hypothetical protein